MQTRVRTEFRLFRGWTGEVLLRPWFDWCAVRAVTRWLLPVSRAWAAGVAAEGSTEAFFDSLGIDPALLPKAEKILARQDTRRQLSLEANEQWERAFFGPADPGPKALAQAEANRFRRSSVLMATRGSFLPVRRNVRKIGYRIASVESVTRAHGERLTAPSAFPAPPDTAIEYSRTFQRNGRVELEAEARFQALQSRIRPHFLFNCMNTIASLTRRSPALATAASGQRTICPGSRKTCFDTARYCFAISGLPRPPPLTILPE